MLTQTETETRLTELVSFITDARNGDGKNGQSILAMYLHWRGTRDESNIKETFDDYVGTILCDFEEKRNAAIADECKGFHVASNCEIETLRGLTIPQAATRLIGDLQTAAQMRRTLRKTLREKPGKPVWGTPILVADMNAA